MKMTPEKGQFLIAAMDNYVKEKGLAVAGMAAMMLVEIQTDLAESTQSAKDSEPDEPKPAPASSKK